MRYFMTKEARANGGKFVAPRGGDAGYDLRAAIEEVRLSPGEFRWVSTGVHVEIPDGFVGLIRERGSTGSKLLTVRAGVVDSAYRGEIKVGIYYAPPNEYLNDIFNAISTFTGVHIAKANITMKVTMENMRKEYDYIIERGDKIAQLVIVPTYTQKTQSVRSLAKLGETARGSSGFGSTGK